MGELIFLTVRNAAKLAVYVEVSMRAKNHQVLVSMRPGIVIGVDSVLPCTYVRDIHVH